MVCNFKYTTYLTLDFLLIRRFPITNAQPSQLVKTVRRLHVTSAVLVRLFELSHFRLIGFALNSLFLFMFKFHTVRVVIKVVV